MNLNLNKTQLKKIKAAFNKKTDVTIQLKNSQIGTGKEKFHLTETQISKLNKSKKEMKGVRLELKFDQIKQGGFLPLLFAGIGAASALAGGVSAVANTIIDRKHKKVEEKEVERHNREMEKIAKNTKALQIGSGIKKKQRPVLKKKERKRKSIDFGN